jgi:hypothetical protein
MQSITNALLFAAAILFLGACFDDELRYSPIISDMVTEYYARPLSKLDVTRFEMHVSGQTLTINNTTGSGCSDCISTLVLPSSLIDRFTTDIYFVKAVFTDNAWHIEIPKATATEKDSKLVFLFQLSLSHFIRERDEWGRRQ